MEGKPTINIIGAGNVATHLATALAQNGYSIVCIASRTEENAKLLAEKVGAAFTTEIAQLPDSDVTIITVPDNAIKDTAKELSKRDSHTIVAHTSGATPLEALLPNKRIGVLYPCMTFSASDTINMSRCPFLLEAKDSDTYATLANIAKSIGSGATECNGEARARLHLAAVLASNFANHLLLQAGKVMEQAGLPLEILQPLINQTIEKAFRTNPLDAQTGPARRGDTKTLAKHREIIGNDENLRMIYDTLTQSIERTYRK